MNALIIEEAKNLREFLDMHLPDQELSDDDAYNMLRKLTPEQEKALAKHLVNEPNFWSRDLLRIFIEVDSMNEIVELLLEDYQFHIEETIDELVEARNRSFN